LWEAKIERYSGATLANNVERSLAIVMTGQAATHV
jgi:hypothetical protein